MAGESILLENSTGGTDQNGLFCWVGGGGVGHVSDLVVAVCSYIC